ncbi:MAG TPA: hypothetical protein VFQ60_05105, partial [Patescibacteria group bacterium]|nr:hypothetical protein [Patescibacteria group bacterium]
MPVLILLLSGFIFLLLTCAIILIFLRESSLIFTGAPYISIPKEVIPAILDALELTPTSILFDLGSGDGRVLFAAVKRADGLQGKGIDRSLIPTWTARFQKWKQHEHAVEIMRGDFFQADLSSATHIFVYLFPKLMNELLPKLQKELKPKTRLVSCDYQFADLEPKKIIELEHRPVRAL